MAQELKVHQGGNQEVSQSNPQLQRARAMPVLSPFDEIDRLFDELMPSPLSRLGRSPLMRSLMDGQARMPRVDLIDRDDDFLLRAEVPGIDKDQLDISIDEGSVTLRGTTSHEQHDEQGNYYRREIAQGEFVRAVALPGAVDTSKAKASLKDGVLELVMPKLEAAKRRKIPIK